MEKVPSVPAEPGRVRTPHFESTVPHQSPNAPRKSPALTTADAPAADPRSGLTEPRHRIGPSVAELIGSTVVPDHGVRGRALVGGAHRDPPRTGRHRAVPMDRGVDRLARRRTIGARPDRGVGRTAL
jgi:hypothetical protein